MSRWAEAAAQRDFIQYFRAKQTVPLTRVAVNDAIEAHRLAKCPDCTAGAGAHKPEQQAWPFTASMDGWVCF